MKALVLGATGMLGSAVFRVLGARVDWSVSGTVRHAMAREFFSPDVRDRLVVTGDLGNLDELVSTFERLGPDVVINCVSVTKRELTEAKVLSILSVLPQRLARLCETVGARLIHISSDGVFSGARGRYSESDCPDATDLYGIAKYLGEPRDRKALAIRTSIIGHELQSAHGLLEWFLSQEKECKGFTRAMFSGLPTVELARIIRDIVIPRPDLCGVYHVAARPISKFDLLRLVADVYGKTIEIVPDDHVVIDRSLNAARFRAATGYVAPDWPDLIRSMHADCVPRTSAG